MNEEFERLRKHVGHKINCAIYYGDEEISIECLDCQEKLYSVDRDEHKSTLEKAFSWFCGSEPY